MKINRKNPLLAAYAVIAVVLATQSAQAITYTWDGNNGTSGFGSASGTWAVPTTGTATAGWTTSPTGVTAISGNSITTTTSDALNFGTNTSLNGLGSGTITVSGTVAALSLTFGSQSTGNITLGTAGTTINLGAAATISVGAGSTTVQTIASNLTGAATSLTKSGNILALSGINTNTGVTNITAGALIYRNLGAKAAATHTFSGGTTLGLGVATSGTFFTSTDIDNAFAGNMTGNLSNVVVNANTNVGIDTTAGNFTYATSVSGSPGRGLVKYGANTLTLTGANTHTGITSILGGTLRLENAAAALSSSSLSVGSGTTLQLAADTSSTFNTTGVSLVAANVVSDRLIAGNGVTQILGNAAVSNSTHNFTAGSLVTNTGTAAIQLGNITNASTNVSTVVFNPTTANLIVTGGYTGITSTVANSLTLGGTSLGNRIDGDIALGTRTSINLNKDTASIWTLSGTNSYNGGTALSAGRLQFTNLVSMSALGAVAVTGGTLGVNVGGAGQWTTGVSGNGTIGGLLAGLGGQSGGTVTYAGTVALGFDTSNASPTTQTYAGAITNVGTTLGITKLGVNTLALSGLSDIAASNYSGATTVARGTLAISHATTANLTGGLVFGESAGSTNTGTFDLSAANATFGSLNVRTNSATNNTVTIGSGKTLTLTGSAASNVISVGTNVAGGIAKLQVTGATPGVGTLTVNDATRDIVIANSAGTNSASSAQLDLSGLGTFSATIANLYVGRPAGAGMANDILTLAGSNTINATGNIAIGGSSTGGATGLSKIILGTANTLEAAVFAVGGARSSGTMEFNTGLTNPAVTIRGAGGAGSRTNIFLGDGVNASGVFNGSGGSNTSTGTMNFTGGTVTASVNNLLIATGAGFVAARGRAIGIFTMDGASSNVDINTLVIAQSTNDNTAAVASGPVSLGTFTVTNGTLQVNTAMTLANDIDTTATVGGVQNVQATFAVAGGNATIGALATPVNMILGNQVTAGNNGVITAAVSVTGGTLNVFGDIKEGNLGGGTITSSLALNGGTLDMKGNSIGISGALIDTLTFASGTLSSVGQINNGADLTKTTAGTLTVTGSNTYTGATNATAGKLLLNGTTSASSLVTATNAGTILGGNGTIGGATTLNVGTIHTAGDAVTLANTTGAGTIDQVDISTGITYNQGSIFEWNLTGNTETSIGTRGTNYDAVNTAALATTGTGAIFRVVLNAGQDFSEGFWNTDRTWADIFENTTGTDLDIASIFGGGVQYYNASGEVATVLAEQGSFSLSGTELRWSAVPEPTSALVGLLIGAGLLRRRRSTHHVF